MNPITRVALVTFALVGSASAQPGSGSGSAAPAPTTAKKKAPLPTPAATPAAAEMPKVPQELAELAKSMGGTWRCKGDSHEPGGAKVALTATNVAKLDMDKWWFVENFSAKGAKMTYKHTAYTTYDASAKKWRRLSVDNMGGHMIGSSDGLKDNKMTFHMDSWGPYGAAMFRDYTDASDPKTGVKFWGEMSPDKGKTWAKVYEMTCKK